MEELDGNHYKSCVMLSAYRGVTIPIAETNRGRRTNNVGDFTISDTNDNNKIRVGTVGRVSITT